MSEVALKLNLSLLTTPLVPFLSTSTIQLMRDMQNNDTASLDTLEHYKNNVSLDVFEGAKRLFLRKF